MLAHMKKLPIDNFEEKEKDYYTLEEYRETLEGSRASRCLRGLRLRENLTQVQFAEIIGVAQTNLSMMENNKRPIGKSMAKRIAQIFKTDYRLFL